MKRRHPALRTLRTHLLRRLASAAVVVAAAAMPAWWMGGRWSAPPAPSQGPPGTATVAGGDAALASFKTLGSPTAGR